MGLRRILRRRNDGVTQHYNVATPAAPTAPANLPPRPHSDTPSETLYLDRDGNHVTLAVYAKLLADPDYRRVAKADVGAFTVSTVWLGALSPSGGSNTEAQFETMVFGPLTTAPGQQYATEAEARAGHTEWLGKARTWDERRSTCGHIDDPLVRVCRSCAMIVDPLP